MDGNLDQVRHLEQSMLNAWPSTRLVHSDGWVFRHACGYTKRANSAQALLPSARFDNVLANARSFYAMHEQPAIFRLTPLANADADAMLADHGFDTVDPTLVMNTAIRADADRDPAVTISTENSKLWSGSHAAANGLSSRELSGHIAILNTIALPTAYATWLVDGRPMAFGLGVLDYGRLGLFNIVTLPSARRQGGARRIVSSLLGWGRSHGAHTAWLSVLADNAPAISLYEQLGFEERYRYHYRIEAND